jgi:hypothetical protein
LSPGVGPGFEPFTQELVDVLVAESRGLPRALNMLASTALERALRECIELPKAEWCSAVTPEHLERALAREGAAVYATVDRSSRATLSKIFLCDEHMRAALRAR